MRDEMLDFVDENDNVIGQIRRSEIDATKLIRRLVALMVFNSAGDAMICRNAKSKSGCPKWKFSVSGHVAAAEAINFALLRETYEEIGIELTDADITEIGVVKMLDDDGERRKIQHVFRVTHDGPFKIDASEIAEYRFVTPDEIDRIIATDPTFFTKTFHRFWAAYKK